MATATTEIKTDLCTVRHGDEWVEIISSKGVSIRIDGSQAPGAWDFFDAKEKALLDRLGFLGNGQQIRLTAQEMWCFKKAHDRMHAEIRRLEEAERDSVDGISNAQFDAALNQSVQDQKEEEKPAACHFETDVNDIDNVEKSGPTTQPITTKAPPASTPPPKPMGRGEATSARVLAHANGKHMLVFYRIPSVLPDGTNGSSLNPSGRWRRYGFRVDGSVWVIPTHQLQYIQEDIDAMHVYPEIVIEHAPYSESDPESVSRQARRAMSEDLAEIHKSLLKSLDDATAQYNRTVTAVDEATQQPKQLTSKQQKTATVYRNGLMRAALKRAGEKLNDSVQAAILFDETMALSDLMTSVRQAIAAQNAAFNLLVEAQMT